MGNYTSIPVNLEFFRTAPAQSRRDLASIQPSLVTEQRTFAKHMRAFYAEKNAIKRDHIAGNAAHLLKPYLPPRDRAKHGANDEHCTN
jgi:hypothetical protein